MEILVEIDFDSGTRRYSRAGARRPSGYYESRVVAFGGIQREIGLVPGDFRASTVSITFNNTDGEFSRLRAAESWRNRLLRVLLFDFDDNTVSTALVARISTWSITRLTCTIDAVDAIQQRLTRPLNYVLDSGLFGNLPDATPRALIPLVVGAVSSPGGAVPAYLVEPSVDIAPFRYVACQGRAGAIDDVYAYGVLVDPGDYAISYGPGPQSTEVTFIDFDADPRTADTAEPHVSWNGSGITDDETETGNPVNNGADQLVKVLRRNGFAANEIDATTVAAAADALTAKQIQGAFVATDRELTVGDVVRQFAESYNLQVFSTNAGLIGMAVPVTTVDEEAVLPEVTALEDVVGGSFEVRGPDEVAATLRADYAYNWYAAGFGARLERSNQQQVGALGENLAVASAHPFIRGSAAATAVADTKLFFVREQRQVVTVLAPPHWHQDLELGALCRLTHFAGIGESGYDRRTFGVLGIALEDVGRGTLAARLTLVDLTSEPVLAIPLGDFSQLSWVASDYYRAGRLSRGRLRFGAAVETGGGLPLGVEALMVGKTTVVAHLGIAFNLAGATAAGSTSVSANLSQLLITDGLAHLWPFEDGSGQTLSDVVGSAHGQLGSGAGSDANDPSWIDNGPHGFQGLDFDGANDYVVIPFFQNPSDGDWTLIIVFRSRANTKTILSQVGAANSADWLAHTSANAFATGLTTPAHSAATINNGVWYLGAIRRNFAANQVTMNLWTTASKPESTVTSNVPGVSGGTGHILGVSQSGFPGTPSFGLDGQVTYLMHYNRRLDGGEMTTLFNGVKTILAPRGISL